MSNTKIKAGQFSGIVGHGTDGYFLMTNGDGTMAWAEGGATGPSVTSVSYPGDDLAADPAGGQTVVLTGTNFGSSMTVSIGGTTAPSVAHDSSTQLTITTPAKAAGDYDIVVTNTVTGASGTFVNGISYNGVPTWTTAAGSLGTFESETTISTITLQATEPDGGTITFNITNGALPTGLSLTGANIDGTTTAESSTTLYSFTIEAIDDENQSTPRNFSITVNAAELISSENFTINTYTGNGSTQSIEGKIGTAASFNGSSSVITNASRLGLGTNPTHSVSLWVNFAGTANQNLYGFGDTTTNFTHSGLQIDTSLNRIYHDNTGNADLITNYSFSTGQWYHIAFTYDSSTSGMVLYINGTQVNTGTRTLNITSPGFRIGRRPGSNNQYLNGKIDQFRVFNKALSSSEVTTLYGENNASSTKSTTDIFDDGSGVALYEFEEGAKDTGGTYNGTPTNVSFVGTSFQPDLVWVKSRSNPYNHYLYDSIRGANNQLLSNASSGEATVLNRMTSFDTNGFTVEAAGSFPNQTNGNGLTFAAWCWKAGGSVTPNNNTEGSITSTVSANPDAGFSVVSWTGTGSAGSIGHGLSSAPELIIMKNRDGTNGWVVRSSALGNGYLLLNGTGGYSSTVFWGTPTNSVFSIPSNSSGAILNNKHIAYCFHSVDGYQKTGSYTGTSASGNTIVTGFQPRFLLTKRASADGGGWNIFDSARGTNKRLFPHDAAAEATDGTEIVTFNSNGFTFNTADSWNNNSLYSYIYLAIA